MAIKDQSSHVRATLYTEDIYRHNALELLAKQQAFIASSFIIQIHHISKPFCVEVIINYFCNWQCLVCKTKALSWGAVNKAFWVFHIYTVNLFFFLIASPVLTIVRSESLCHQWHKQIAYLASSSMVKSVITCAYVTLKLSTLSRH